MEIPDNLENLEAWPIFAAAAEVVPGRSGSFEGEGDA
jgi:hypothetical protein